MNLSQSRLLLTPSRRLQAASRTDTGPTKVSLATCEAADRAGANARVDDPVTNGCAVRKLLPLGRMNPVDVNHNLITNIDAADYVEALLI
jgi:hypothetical protein